MARGRYRFSTRDDGDFRIDGDPADLRSWRQQLAPGDWTWLRQVHGPRVVVVSHPGEHAGEQADAAVTDVPGAVLAVHTADCLPLLLMGDGAVGAVHVGWRGLVSGVVEASLDTMASLGSGPVTAVIGPHIRARCYEFGAADLDHVAARYGAVVRSETAWATPALDIAAGVRSALDGRRDVVAVESQPGCTACEPERFYSHRARADTGRHAAAITLVER